MAGKKKILVAADGSAESQSVVKYVAAMLSPVDTEVVFLHVLNRIPETYWDFGLGVESDSLVKKIRIQVAEHEKSIKAFMADSKQALLDANFREENIALHIEDRMVGIARDIVAEARRGYNGLIMGRTGMGQMKGLAVGSVSTKIIRCAVRHSDLHRGRGSGWQKLDRGSRWLTGIHAGAGLRELTDGRLQRQDRLVSCIAPHRLPRAGNRKNSCPQRC